MSCPQCVDQDMPDRNIPNKRSDSDLSDGTSAGTVQWINSAEKYAAMFEQAGGTSAIGSTPVLSGASRTGWEV